MKTVPTRSINEIAQEILSRHGGSLEEIRGKHGHHKQEITWLIALICVAARKDNWGLPAIARFLEIDHATVYYHCKDKNGQSMADKPA